MSSLAEQTETENNISTLSQSKSFDSEIFQLVLDTLDESKAENIVSIDLEGKSSLCDYMVIASGTSSRHVASMAEKIVIKLKESGHGHSRVEGMQTSDWVLIDAGDIIIHLFRPEVRDFYNLEKIWLDDEANREIIS